MSLKQAAEWSNIGKQRLIKLAEAEKIVGFSDPDSGRRDWIFDRHSIDTYRSHQYDRSRLKIFGKKTAAKILETLPT